METLFVKINKGRGWYKGLEGEIFEVYDNIGNLILKEDLDRGHKAIWCHILKDDCSIIEVENV